jgi:hypothetical protein
MYHFWCCFMKTKNKHKIDINSITFFKEDQTGMTMNPLSMNPLSMNPLSMSQLSMNPLYIESDDMNLFNAPKERPKLNRKSRTELNEEYQNKSTDALKNLDEYLNDYLEEYSFGFPDL